MEEKRYELRILPLFEEKLQEMVDYIAFRLKASARIRGNQALGFGPLFMSVHPSIGGDDRQNTPPQDVLVFRLVEEALIHMRRLQLPVPNQRPHDAKAHALCLCLNSHISYPFQIIVSTNTVPKLSRDSCLLPLLLLY